jgi:hypothetical protein
MKQVSMLSVELVPLMIEALDHNKSISFKVSGTSMMPFFKHQKTTIHLIKKGEPYHRLDVVLFKYQDGYRLHRIMKINPDQVVASGDNLLSKEVFHPSQIIGFVESFGQIKMIKSHQMFYRLKVFLWLLFKPILIRLRGLLK